MAKRKGTGQAPASGRGRELAELRRSSAAGLHVKRRRNRARARRSAIEYASI